MKKVKVIHVGTGNSHTLSPSELAAFAQEFRRTAPGKRRKKGSRVLRIGPDARILVTSANGRIREYTLHGRAVLHDPTTGRDRQFYMGLLLLELVR
jgi:hypothetical protein